MDVAFEGAHMIWDGVLCCTADDPEAYYAADARRVLELFVLAAEQGLELKADTLLAAAGLRRACGACPGARRVQRHSGFCSPAHPRHWAFCAPQGRMHLSGCRSAPCCMAWRRRPPCLWRGGGCICGGAGHPPCGTHRCAPRWNWTPLCRS